MNIRTKHINETIYHTIVYPILTTLKKLQWRLIDPSTSIPVSI